MKASSIYKICHYYAEKRVLQLENLKKNTMMDDIYIGSRVGNFAIACIHIYRKTAV